MTLEGIVSDYIRHYRTHARNEMRFFANQRRASDAIGNAALCMLPNGKRHPHQYRIPKAVLEEAEMRLQAVEKRMSGAPDFDSLHAIIQHEIESIRGIGALTVYDISHRLAAYFGKLPQRVYLHAGTKMGAIVFGLQGDSIDPRELPDAFSRLAATEIEDCLCIYKEQLLAWQESSSSLTWSRPRGTSICSEMGKSYRLSAPRGCKGRAL
jgi:hypothetical protein